MVRLTKEQKQFYQDNGYIILKNAVPTAELDRIAKEYDKLFIKEKQDSTVKTIYDLEYYHAVFSKLLFNENMLDAVEDVLGTENIVLHHTKGHHKLPGDGAVYPVHQDYHFDPYEKHTMVVANLFLDAANGGLFVYPGTHKLGPLEDFGAKEGSNCHYVDQSKFPLETATYLEIDCGDLLIFSSLLVHSATVNNSSHPRRMLLVKMASVDDRPVGKQPLGPSQGMMLRGVNLHRDSSQHI